ncbi:MAG: IS110 family transposase [Nitrospirae bacterium]|nr:IS110 family transposase [Nitrospirota bacterium]
MKKIKPKRPYAVNKKVLIATVDGGKEKHYGYFRCPDGTDGKSLPFENSGKGFREFLERITSAARTHGLEEIIVGFESTGPYMEPLAQFLKSKRGIRLVQVNPMHTKRLKELAGNSPLKTDRKDPKVIADIIELGHALTVVIPEGPAAELRRLTQGRERTITSRTRLFNQLQCLLASFFPEFLQVMNDVTTASAQHLLKHHPTPQDIVNLGEAALASLLRKVSRGKLREDRARALFEASSASVGIRDGRDSMLLEIRLILETIDAYDRFIEDSEAGMVRQLEQIPYSRIILSLKGIGSVTAAGLIGEVGDFTKFGTISEVMKLAGLDLYEVSSGKHRGKLRISKRGRPLMRKLLYLAALSAVRKNGVMHAWYQQALNRGMQKTKALVAVSRKLLVLIFALVRDHSVYVENYVKPILQEAA